jgi:hypothetical protein
MPVLNGYASGKQSRRFFKAGRNGYGMDNLRSREFKAIYGFLWLVFIGHNLLQWVKQELFAESGLASTQSNWVWASW